MTCQDGDGKFTSPEFVTWILGPHDEFAQQFMQGWFHETVLFLELRLVGKGRNPQSQITVLKAIVQATGDSLGARVSETLGYQKRQGSGRKRYLFVSMVCIHQVHAHISTFIYMICATYLGCIPLCPVLVVTWMKS